MPSHWSCSSPAPTSPATVAFDELVEANTAMWTVAVAAQVVLAPVAGVLVAAVGPGVAFGVNAASYVVSALVLWPLRAGRDSADVVTRCCRPL